MAKNDTVVIDSIIQQRMASVDLTPVEKGDAFQRLAIEQVLKHRTPEPEELEEGIVDGTDDGGVDGLFVVVNGLLMGDVNSVPWPRSGVELEVWILTCKHHETFRQAPLDNLYASVAEILDLSLSSEDLKGQYSEEILRRRIDLYYAYERAAHAISSLAINVAYISRGDTGKIGESIVARSEQITTKVKELFRECVVRFDFIGAAEIVDLYRRTHGPRRRLPFVELLSSENSYAVLVTLKDLAAFVTDEQGELRQEFFDSNVRDFMGLNPVNQDIRSTLCDRDSPEFWWLNNGVTILATTASVVGKQLVLEEIQIVNGLQTTESIFRYFKGVDGEPLEGSVLVKVIQSTDDSVRDAIIRSTNNQTAVEAASLYATDKVQRDIEEVLRVHGLRYERRKNYYVNRRVASDRIVTPLYIGSGFVALGLKNPNRAPSFGSGAIRNAVAYQRVFGHNHDINMWVVVAAVLKFTDRMLYRSVRRQEHARRFVQNWRHVSAFLYVVRTLGTFGYSIGDLAGLDVNELDEDLMTETIGTLRGCKSRTRRLKRWSQSETQAASKLVSEQAGIGDLVDWKPSSWGNEKGWTPSLIEEDLVKRVNELLPDQPWKPGVHGKVAEKLGCGAGMCSRAIQLLIHRGVRYQQVDGVVYDTDGYVISVDRERVSEEQVWSLRGRDGAE